MAEQRDLKELTEEELNDLSHERQIDPPMFSTFLIPFEIITLFLRKLSPATLFAFRINRFFQNFINDFIAFFEEPKLTLIHIFRFSSPYHEESQVAKRTFRQLIIKSKQKISLKGIPAHNIPVKKFDTAALSLKYIDLEGVDCLGTSFSPVKKTDLWNKIEFTTRYIEDVFAKHIDTREKYNQFLKLLEVNCYDYDLVEHFILYHLPGFPTESELKKCLAFKFASRSLPEDAPLVLVHYWIQSFHNGQSQRKKFSLWVTCPSEHKVAFKAWIEAIRQFIKIGNQYLFFGTATAENGDEQFMLVLDDAYAYTIFRNNPVITALRLYKKIQWWLAEDTVQTCDFLSQELEKFKGFKHGIPDETLHYIKTKLENVKKLQPQIQAIDAWIQASKNINVVLLREKINQLNLSDVRKTDLFNKFKNKKFSSIIQTIKNTLETHPNDNTYCLAVLKEQINQENLSVDERILLFNKFKHRGEFNHHQNPRLDYFLGLKYTAPFRKVWKEIRDDAKKKLFAEVDALEAPQDKHKMLLSARKNTFFSEHRNNFFWEGAFGRTQAVIDIDEKQRTIQRLGRSG